MLTSLLFPFTVSADVRPELFDEDALLQEPTIVDCMLEDGTEAQCVEFLVSYIPENLPYGPFCPETLEDVGGIWNWDGDDAGLYRINGAFLEFLDEQGYTFFDENGDVGIVDIRTGEQTSEATTENVCLEASFDTEVEITILLPLTPTEAETVTELGTVSQVGLALDTVPIFADAPSVADTGNLPALDVCGGHIDPGGYYHWHATATDIRTPFKAQKVRARCGIRQDSEALFGYAYDGYAMYGSKDANGVVPTNLDECGGHVGQTPQDPLGIYHYHSTDEFANLPSCLKGVLPINKFSTNASMGIGDGSGGETTTDQ